MSQKILDPRAIEAMIPYLQRIADDLEAAYAAVAAVLRSSPQRDAELGVAGSLARVQGFVDELEALGGALRAYTPVRVDFLAEVDGEIGYVCWQSGDREALLFHGATEPCQGSVLSA